MFRPHPRRGIKPAVLLTALLSCVCPRSGLAALAPATAQESESRDKNGMGTGAGQQESIYALVPVRWGGSLGYDMRRDWGGDGSASQQSIRATLTASADMPIWQPWLGKLSGNLSFSGIRTSGHQNVDSLSDDNLGIYSLTSKNITVTGDAQLSLFPLSRFPFEAHFRRTDSRISSTLSALDGYTSQRLGFSQNYRWAQGNVMFGWDRDTQTSLAADVYKQNVLQLALSQNLGPNQAFNLTGNATRNTHENTGDFSQLNNLYARHTVRSGDALTLESAADISRSHYRLTLGQRQTESSTRLAQLNSYGTWKPLDQPLTVNGGVRVTTSSNRWGTGLDGDSATTQSKNLNLNAGATYSLSKTLQMIASANVNLANAAGTQTTSTMQTAGMAYTAEPIALGSYQYTFMGAANATNRTGGPDSGQLVQGQFSQNLGRNIAIGQGSNLSAQVSQSVSAEADTHFGSSRQLTHTGLVAWNASYESASSLLQLNASDTRTTGTNPGFFQLINAQATGNLNSGRFISWSGGLTIQATRQRHGLAPDPQRPDGFVSIDTGAKFIPTSSGSLTYRNQRAFGVPRLLFVSELRLNSQSLLPMVGGPLDQESASWENRLEYTVGRIFLRFNTRISKISGRINKAILMTVTREFGN